MNSSFHNDSSIKTKKQKSNINESAFSVQQIKTNRDSLNVNLYSASGKSLPTPNLNKHLTLDSFLQDKDLALQPLDFLDFHAIIQSKITVKVNSDNEDDYKEDNLSEGFNSAKEEY